MKKILSLTIIIFLSIIVIIRASENNSINYSADTTGTYERVHFLIDNYSSNIDSLQAALTLSNNSKNSLLIGLSRGKIGNYYAKKDNYTEAINNFSIAAEKYFSIDDTLKYLSNLRVLAIMNEYAGNIDTALVLYTQCLDIFKILDNKKGLNTINADMGVLYWNLSEYAKSLEHFNKSLEYTRELNDSSRYSSLWNNIGLVYWNLGDHQTALKYFYKSLELDEILQDTASTSYSLNNIGLIYEEMEDYDKALYYHKQSLEIELKQRNESGAATSYSNIGVIYGLKKDYKNALLNANKSLEIQKKLSYKSGIAQAYVAISDIYYKLNDFEKSLIYNLKSLEIKNELGNKQGIATCHIKYGEIYIELKEFSKAINHLNTAFEISNNIESKRDIMYISKLLSKTYSEIDQYKNAYKYQKLFSDLGDEIYSEEKTKSISEMNIRFDVQKKEQQIDLLEKEQEVKNAELERSNAEINNQKNVRNFSIVAFLLLFGILGLLFNRYKINQKKKRYLLEKSNIEFENKLLRSQMNPHFIFNSLYSIQSFVAKNQSELAVSHLSNFAALMRAILHNSSKSFISLEKELETIDLYLKLEKLRFENRFDYTINMPDDIESEFIQIPPMLVQPFIENAIIHGFPNKNEKGKINITFKEINNLHLLCIVSDNGIGRDKAGKLKDNKKKNHKSMGIDITKNRLNLLNNEMGTNCNINVQDLDKESNTGTVVEILMPIKES